MTGRTEQRAIHLTIAPATATTCGDGTGAFCPWLHATHLGAEYFCLLWGTLQDENGWLQRRAECLLAETERDAVETVCDEAEAER